VKNEKNPPTKSCGFCKSYKLEDIKYPMEKIKPLWDDIWLKRPLYEEEKVNPKKEAEMKQLQDKVTKIETDQMIQWSINQCIFSKINPGVGTMPQNPKII
jgi:hypothetical protein